MKIYIVALLMFFVSGCTIKQEITPVPLAMLLKKELCIVKDPETKSGFLRAFKDEMQLSGYDVRLINEGNSPDDCELKATYIGKWSWDLAIYLSYADIKVFNNNKLVGHALYDSTKGGGNVAKKFVNGDAKVRELVRLLFSEEIEEPSGGQ